MEPISVFFEVGEPAPGRETAAGVRRRFLQPLTRAWTSSQATFRFGRFHSSWKLSGGMLAGTQAIQRKRFSLSTPLLVSEKQKNHPNLPPPAVTPQANANLPPRIRAAPH